MAEPLSLRRLRRAESLERMTQRYQHCRRTAGDLSSTLSEVKIRRDFLARKNQDDPKPQLTSLISPGGFALRMALFAFLIQQQQSRSSDPLSLRTRNEGDSPSWSDLVMLEPGVGRQDDRRRAGRSVMRAIRTLSGPEINLISQRGGSGQKRRIKLHREGAVDQIEQPYRRPHQDRYETLEIPIEFFTNGWIFVLSDAEIATYLTYRLEFQVNKNKPVWLSGSTRMTRYGLTEYADESRFMLNSMGVIKTYHDKYRRPDGTIPRTPQITGIKNYYSQEPIELLTEDPSLLLPKNDTVAMCDEGLQKDALPTILKSLRKSS